jgi:hypothetical protein
LKRSITQSDVAAAAAESVRDAMYHCMPGSVVAFYGSEQTVDVQPTVNDVRTDLVSGARISEPWPVIPHVPIAFPRFGGYAVAGPMSVGDRVLLVAFDLDPTAWRQTGNRSDPGDASRHAGGYWLAIPCDLTVPGVMKDAAAAAQGLVIGVDGAAPQIRINGSNIQLGNAGGDFIALASKVQTAIADLATWVKTGVAPPGGGTVTYAAPAPADSVGSTLTKAQ